MKTRLGDNTNIDVAVDASPWSCVIAGPKDSVTNLCKELAHENIQCRAVASDLPFHSRMLLDLVEPLKKCLEDQIFTKPPRIPLYSTSAPDPRSTEMRGVTYWTNNMVQPVLPETPSRPSPKTATGPLSKISSHPIASHSISETLELEALVDAVVMPTMLRNKSTMRCILTCVPKLHCFGFRLASTEQINRPWCPGVPRTAWSHEPYWRAVAKVPLGHTSTHTPASNNLLGTPTSLGGGRYCSIPNPTRRDE
ncbi:Type I Iterative PKS [Apiospora phragmitis]|uniref:Type I Iterative PKS n=1 Tax=Apiospora phragmitis TaxID=2905665 RepID=A0ABR1USH0_9PEZI